MVSSVDLRQWTSYRCCAFDEPLDVAQPVLGRLDLIHKDIVVQSGRTMGAPVRRDGGAVPPRSGAGSNTSSFQTSRMPDQNVVVNGELIQVEPWEVDRWCRKHLGSGIDEELFRYGHLSAVIGIRLISGPQV